MYHNFSTLRLNMVNGQLRPLNVTDSRVLEAFLKTPRENFVDKELRDIAYIEGDLPISMSDPKRYIMNTSALARLVQLCDFKHSDKVLHLGANLGYASAIIATLVRHVVALEEDVSLYDRLKQAMASYNNVTVKNESLDGDSVRTQLYDAIFVEGCVQKTPDFLTEQLKPEGRLVCVEGNAYLGMAKIYNKSTGWVSVFNVNIKPLPGFEDCSENSFFRCVARYDEK